jgi:hypothetical protein
VRKLNGICVLTIGVNDGVILEFESLFDTLFGESESLFVIESFFLVDLNLFFDNLSGVLEFDIFSFFDVKCF